jgi:threonylcarbamoyladenosine tRNA methylthiotransferase MtaB
MPTVAFYTLGCKLNQYETESIRERFEAQDYTVVPFTDPADVYVINTCAVTGKSEYTSRKMIRRAIKTRPQAKVVAVGCYSQVAPDALSRIPGVDLVLGNSNKTRVLAHLNDPQAPDLAIGTEADFSFEDFDISSVRSRSRAFIKIQEGCRSFCTYCIIPQARGELKSRPLESILGQIRKLAAAGYREVVITGTHLGMYGKENAGGTALIDVFRSVCQVAGIRRVRISSIEPMDLTDELIEYITGEPKICRHLHIALQSGDDAILNKMNRPYTARDAAAIMRRLARDLPGICLGTDVITGFPGETRQQFNTTYTLLKGLPLAYLHVFPFSPRPHTPAAGFKDQLPPEIVRPRVRRLQELRSRKIRQFRQQFIGQPLEVLVESTRERKTNKLVGLSDNYLRILFEGKDELKNTFVTVIPGRIAGEMLQGKITC